MNYPLQYVTLTDIARNCADNGSNAATVTFNDDGTVAVRWLKDGASGDASLPMPDNGRTHPITRDSTVGQLCEWVAALGMSEAVITPGGDGTLGVAAR